MSRLHPASAAPKAPLLLGQSLASSSSSSLPAVVISHRRGRHLRLRHSPRRSLDFDVIHLRKQESITDRPGTSISSGARRHGSGRTLSSPGEKRPRAFRGFGGDCMVDFRSILFPRLTFEPHCCSLYIRLVSVHLIIIILNRSIFIYDVHYHTVDKQKFIH